MQTTEPAIDRNLAVIGRNSSVIKNKTDLLAQMSQGKKLIRRRKLPFTQWTLNDEAETVVKVPSIFNLIKSGQIKETESFGSVSYYGL